MLNENTSSEMDYEYDDFSNSKRPKMTSKVWEEMERIPTTDGSKVLCKHCGKLLQDNCGTSHLKRHLMICPKRPKPLGVNTQDSMSSMYLRGTSSAKGKFGIFFLDVKSLLPQIHVISIFLYSIRCHIVYQV